MKTFNFTYDVYKDINNLYIKAVDDDKIINWIENNIKSKKGMSAEGIFSEFERQKKGK
jgi:hypothetical protein